MLRSPLHDVFCPTHTQQVEKNRRRAGEGESTTGGNTEYTQQVCVVGVEWWLAEGVWKCLSLPLVFCYLWFLFFSCDSGSKQATRFIGLGSCAECVQCPSWMVMTNR